MRQARHLQEGRGPGSLVALGDRTRPAQAHRWPQRSSWCLKPSAKYAPALSESFADDALPGPGAEGASL